MPGPKAPQCANDREVLIELNIINMILSPQICDKMNALIYFVHSS